MSPSTGRTAGDSLESAVALLTAAEVPSPDVDARILLAAVLGVEPKELVRAAPISSAQAATYDGLIRRRAGREPLQHITGKAWFRHLELAVGPGVFVPRPETEVLVDLALAEIRSWTGTERALVVDLCTGSGAIGLSLLTESDVELVAIELSDDAYEWASRNFESVWEQGLFNDRSVQLVKGDATALSDELPAIVGSVDVVACNPPYIPDRAIPRDPEVRDYDPAIALFGGPDGLDLVRGIVDEAARLLRPGGLLLIEHGDEQGTFDTGGVPQVVVDAGWFEDVRDERDLTGRPRVTLARRR